MSTENLNLIDAVHVTVRPSILKRKTQRSTRHLVKWKVGTADKTRSCKSSIEAQTFHTDLRTALRNRERFDPKSGLPESMLLGEADTTVLDLACELVAEKWAGWSGGNRRARVEALADLCAILVEGTRGRPPRELMRRWARDKELPPEGRRMPLVDEVIEGRLYTVAEQQKAADWMIAHSLPVSALADTRLVKKTLAAAAVGPDGVPYGPDTAQRSRSSLSKLCLLAVEEKLLATNPVRDTERAVDDESDEVDPSMVPSPTQARQLVEAACAVSKVARVRVPRSGGL